MPVILCVIDSNITQIQRHFKGMVHRYQSHSSSSKHYIITVTIWHIIQYIFSVSCEHRVLFSAKETFPCKMVAIINAYQRLIAIGRIGQTKPFIIPMKH